MKLRRLAAAAVLAMAALNAQAITTYTFTVTGTQTHFRDDWECPGSVCVPGSSPISVSDWGGTFTLTAPDGDGTFLFDWPGETPNMTLSFSRFPGSASRFSFGIPPDPQFGAVISGGQVVSLSGSGLLFESLPPGHWAFDGTNVTFDNPAEHHYGETFGRGTLALTAPVPEPETWALLLSGLAVIGASSRRRRIDGAQVAAIG